MFWWRTYFIRQTEEMFSCLYTNNKHNRRFQYIHSLYFAYGNRKKLQTLPEHMFVVKSFCCYKLFTWNVMAKLTTITTPITKKKFEKIQTKGKNLHMQTKLFRIAKTAAFYWNQFFHMLGTILFNFELSLSLIFIIVSKRLKFKLNQIWACVNSCVAHLHWQSPK